MNRGKGQFRILAVDLILVLMMTLKDLLGLDSDDEVESIWGLGCLEALIQHCSDVTAGVRARALTNLAQLVGHLSQNDRSRALLKELMGIGNEMQGGMNNILQRWCLDEKAAVRKAALFLISKLMPLLGSAFDEYLMKTVGMAFSDPLLSIRKAALSALSEAFRLFSSADVTKEWLHSVPRLIADNEYSIQDECENLFSELVLDRVSKVASGIMGILKETCDGEVTPWIRKICTSLGKKKKLKPRIATALQNIITASESLWLSHSMPIEKRTAPPGAWFLLSEVSAFLPKEVDWEFLHHHWQLLDKYKPSDECRSSLEQRDVGVEVDIESSSVTWAGDRVFLLQAISNVTVKLPPEPAANLAHNFLKRLEEFNMHSTEVNAHVKALRTLCKRKALNPDEAENLVAKWVYQLLSKACHVLEKYISEDSEANKDSTSLTPRNSGQQGKRAAASRTKQLSQTIAALYTIGSLVIICPSTDLKDIGPLLHTIITSGNHVPKSKISLGHAVSIKHTAPS